MSVPDGVPGKVEGVDIDLALSGEVRELFGPSYDSVSSFAEMLAREGELRGLIGPRELPRLWERHIINSAAVVPYLPTSGTVADIGSGAGLPGIVIAAMRPDLHVRLIEPMERRCVWLSEVSSALGLGNVEVLRGRAEEFHDAFEVDVVTARAVAALDKLSRLSLPLVAVGGEMVILKGKNVAGEVSAARKVLRKFGSGEPEIIEAVTIAGLEPTTVVRIQRTR